mgnify:CR=1 FL=1
MSVLLVSCSFPDETLALAVAGAAVDEGLAACCQVSAPVTSLYRWEGRTERAAEVIAWPITHGLPAYLDWVRLNTTAGSAS